eukprot:TRINITY_DN20544_c0_g1_i1.p1 TRINITY_DN20544_c0_g1~~TRINITY_DN20544_c0_g1_i1.p1  ORF type:complete len:296 (+),score=34.38 TRINITY_DN20544_c0_g1_i1:48-935(+)
MRPSKIMIGLAIFVLVAWLSSGTGNSVSSEVRAFPTCEDCKRDVRWENFQKKLQMEAGNNSPYDIMFIGDSITESYRGTSLGRTECLQLRCTGVPKMFADTFRHAKSTGIHGISGDQTAHVLWRLQTKEGLAVRTSKTVVLLIGTNDISARLNSFIGGWQDPKFFGPVEPTLRSNITDTLTHQVIDVVNEIKRLMTSPKIVLLGILPRGESFRPTPRFSWPNKLYTDIITHVNTALEASFKEDPFVLYTDCSKGFLSDSGIKEETMYDALHPTGVGAKYLMECSKDGVDKILATP